MLGMLAFLSFVPGAAEPPDLMPDEPNRPSHVRTRIDVRCLDREIAVRFRSAYPGRHVIEGVAVDGVELREDQHEVLRRLVGLKAIDGISVVECESRAGILAVRLLVDFGSASARDEGSPELRTLVISNGRVTVLD